MSCHSHATAQLTILCRVGVTAAANVSCAQPDIVPTTKLQVSIATKYVELVMPYCARRWSASPIVFVGAC